MDLPSIDQGSISVVAPCRAVRQVGLDSLCQLTLGVVLDRDTVRLGGGQTTAIILSVTSTGVVGAAVGDSGSPAPTAPTHPPDRRSRCSGQRQRARPRSRPPGATATSPPRRSPSSRHSPTDLVDAKACASPCPAISAHRLGGRSAYRRLPLRCSSDPRIRPCHDARGAR